MNALTARLELSRSRTLVFWLAFSIGLYAGTMTAFYPRMTQDVEAVNKLLDLWPKEMLAAFNIEGNLMELGTFYNVYVFTLIWPWIAALAGILIPTRTIAVDLERGFLELPLATPLSRERYLISSIASQAAVMAVLAVALIGPILVAGALAGVAIDAGRFILVGLLAFTFGCAIAAATTLLSVATLSRGTAGGLVAGGLMVMYLIQTIAKLAPELANASYISAFRYFSPVPIIRDGAIPFGDLAVFSLAAVVMWAIAVRAFRRRDLVP